MTIKNIILLGTLAVATFASCSDEMDYKEYSNYDKNYVFNNLDNTVGFVTNIYSYLDYDYGIVGEGMLASACDEAEYSWRSGSINNIPGAQEASTISPMVRSVPTTLLRSLASMVAFARPTTSLPTIRTVTSRSINSTRTTPTRWPASIVCLMRCASCVLTSISNW